MGLVPGHMTILILEYQAVYFTILTVSRTETISVDAKKHVTKKKTH